MKVGTIKLIWAVIGMAIVLVATPMLWGYVHGCPHLTRRLLFGLIAKEYVPGSTVEFRRLSTGHGQGAKGADFEIFQFRSSDCVEVDSFYLKFVSSEDPREEMERRIISAVRIVSPKSEITLDDGDRGERAVILGEREYVILRRIGKTLHSIASASLNHALEFERRDRFEMEAGAAKRLPMAPEDANKGGENGLIVRGEPTKGGLPGGGWRKLKIEK